MHVVAGVTGDAGGRVAESLSEKGHSMALFRVVCFIFRKNILLRILGRN
jgi:hypothetical protein